MKRIDILKIASLVLISASSLIAQDAPKASYAQVVTEIIDKKIVSPVVTPAKIEAVIEKAAEPAPAKIETVVEKAAEPTPAKVEAIVEKAAEPTPAKIEAVVEKAAEPTPAKIEAVVEKAAEPTPAKIEAVVEKAAEPAPAKVEVPKQVQTTSQQVNTQISKTIITMPTVPKAPQVKVIVPKLILLDSDGKLITKESMDSLYKKEEHIFSNRVAPDRFNKNVEHKKEEILAGDIVNARVAAYLHSSLISVDDATSKLEEAGFEILSKFKVDKKGKVISIVLTNPAMKKAASKNIRGFAGTLRIVIDKINKITVISNPIYLMKAFMQKDYDKALAVTTLKSLRTIFKDAKNSQEMIKFTTLERFHFMENMPYYQDMKVVSQGKNKDLLKKAKKSKKIVFEQHLENGSIVIGVKLSKRTSKFVKKIGYQNSGLLPYPVLIEDGKAKILAPQYYIAIMYPQLKMSQFMKIATVPGAISKDIDRVFR